MMLNEAHLKYFTQSELKLIYPWILLAWQPGAVVVKFYQHHSLNADTMEASAFIAGSSSRAFTPWLEG